ncbi:nucleotidyltransferase domain-containing protein [Candidatus Woesearchaeota archaeon]|nr:nucleotidyltransferase domain-containing protein [Candidatus Woesearchaeota archaeon]
MEIVFGSKVKIKILRIMFRFPDKTFTGRELAGLTKEVSGMAVSKSVKDLISMNLVGLEHHGNSNLLKLNKNSYLFEPLKNLFLAEEATIIKLKEKIRRYLNVQHIKTAAIFGSIVKGLGGINSDIDLFIITDNKKWTSETMEKLQKEINLEFGSVLMPYILTKEEFKSKKNKPIIKNIIENNILIIGDKIEN